MEAGTFKQSRPGRGRSLSPEADLRERYGRGEITIEQFERETERLLRTAGRRNGRSLYAPVATPPAPVQAQPRAQKKSGMAIASLVIGVLAMLTFLFWGAVVLSPPAIVFGVLGRSDARKNHRDGERMGTAGLALGITAAVLTVPWAFIVY